LSILYCLCLWIVHSLLPVSLDCPFFIDSLVFSTVYFRWILYSRICWHSNKDINLSGCWLVDIFLSTLCMF
jgi:hypothetical protein